MPKLTETTNDHLAKQGNGQAVYASPAPPPQPPLTAAASEPLKIALIGTAPSSRMLAPFDDKSWKIWGCSPGNMNVLPRFDAWFEIHGNFLWEEYKHYGVPYIKWLNELKVPVFMQDRTHVPHAHIFPKDLLVAEFGRDFFTSTFAWMMAFAIKCGAAEIMLYGIDMASRDEYILQRPGFYFFKEMARQRGVKVSAPKESDIMQPPGLYGYSDVTPFGRKLYARKKEIHDRITQMEQERARLAENIAYLKGAAEDNDYTISIWMGAQDNQSPLMPETVLRSLVEPIPVIETKPVEAAPEPPPPVKQKPERRANR